MVVFQTRSSVEGAGVARRRGGGEGDFRSWRKEELVFAGV